jgi:hypothetical protein
MRVARKSQPANVLKPLKKARHKASFTLVAAAYEVLEDGTHVVTIPVRTTNPNNGATGHSRFAGIMRSAERKTQRAQCAMYLRLFSVPRNFRGIRMTRLAPSSGLDTGGLWAALKAPQDEVAKHLGIDDGPKSQATWEMAQERNPAYGVRVEFRAERADAK